jgi:hypothetical protein
MVRGVDGLQKKEGGSASARIARSLALRKERWCPHAVKRSEGTNRDRTRLLVLALVMVWILETEARQTAWFFQAGAFRMARIGVAEALEVSFTDGWLVLTVRRIGIL